MNPHALILKATAFAVLFGLHTPTTLIAVEGAEGVTAVASRVSNDYVRLRLPNGLFQSEGYTFGDGGDYGGPFPDETIDGLRFLDIARTIAVPLEAQNYISCKDPDGTRLLIMVYWGMTTVPDRGPIRSPSSYRDHLDYRNAAMLGYDSEGVIGTEYGAGLELTALRWHRRDLLTEIEFNRYFVVLLAYDFKMLWKEKRHKLLWETRFSIDQRENDFTKALPVMAQYAAIYFGQDSHGLVRKPVPEGRIDIREPTLIELFDTPKK